jgi:putative tryptophan/tyrosine transport system substrate-binding protein
MRRREVITLLGGAAVTWPVAARAQQPALPVVGFLHSGSPSGWGPFVAAFRSGLKEAGYIEGQNVTIEFRWAEDQSERLPALAADLVRRRVAVIFANAAATLAAKAATTTIPIVFNSGVDPVKLGLVASLNRPGGNITGVTTFSNELAAKRLALLHELAPRATVIAALVNPNFLDAHDQLTDLQEAARKLGLQIRVFNASTESEIDTDFASLAQQGADALIVAADPFFTNRRDHVVALAAHHMLPAIYSLSEWAAAGGLMSYSTSQTDSERQAALYIGKILKGAKPTELPVMQPTRFEFVINIKTARALGLDVPISMQLLADQVIE